MSFLFFEINPGVYYSLKGSALSVSASLLRFTELIQFFLGSTAPTTASSVIIFTKFVSDLSTTPSASELSSLLEAGIKIDPDEAFIQLHPVEELLGLQRLSTGLVFDKTESARCFAMTIESHDDATDLSAFGEELV